MQKVKDVKNEGKVHLGPNDIYNTYFGGFFFVEYMQTLFVKKGI